MTPAHNTPAERYACLIERWRNGVTVANASSTPELAVATAARDVVNAVRMRDGLAEFGVDVDDPVQLRAVVCTLDGIARSIGNARGAGGGPLEIVAGLVSCGLELIDAAPIDRSNP